MTVTSLYMCISYIYAYSYNFYYLSSLHAYYMSTFFPLHVLCLWHSSYLYFFCISVSILHISSLILYLYHISFHVVATRPCYSIHFLHIVLSHIFLYDLNCIVIYFHFYCTVILYFPIFSSFRFMTYCIPCTITYIFS